MTTAWLLAVLALLILAVAERRPAHSVLDGWVAMVCMERAMAAAGAPW